MNKVIPVLIGLSFLVIAVPELVYADSSDGFWFGRAHCDQGALCTGVENWIVFNHPFYHGTGFQAGSMITEVSSTFRTDGYIGKVFDKSEIDGKLLTFELSQSQTAQTGMSIQVFDGEFDAIPDGACGTDCFPTEAPIVTSGSGGVITLFGLGVGILQPAFYPTTPNLSTFDSPTGKVTVVMKLNDAQNNRRNSVSIHSLDIEDMGKFWFNNDPSDVNWNMNSIISSIRDSNAVTPDRAVVYVTKSPFDTPPTVTLTGSPVDIVAQFETYSELGATCFDTQDGQIDGNVIISGDTVDESTVGFYNVDYDCTDSGFLSKLTETRLVVIVDPIIPMIDIYGEDAVTLRNGIDTYTELGAMCLDDFEGDISGNIDIGGDVVNTSVDGTYNVTYDCFDSSLNVAPQIVRTVEVITDTTVPNVTGSTLNINVGGATERTIFIDEYLESCTATDQLPTNPTCTVSSGGIDTTVLGMQTVNYIATDLSGNVGIGLIFTTVVDTIFPNITFSLSSPVEVYQGDTLNELDFITCDDSTEDITNVVTIDTPVDMSSTGVQTVTYSCIDVGSNESTVAVDYFVKKPQSGGGGSSSSSPSTSGTSQSSTPQLSDIPTLSFQSDDTRTESTEGSSISDLFSNLFSNRLNPTEPTQQSQPFFSSPQSSSSSITSDRPSPVADFFSNLFSNIFG